MTQKKEKLPLLPLKNIVVFPGTGMPFFIGREKAIHTFEYAAQNTHKVILVTQKESYQQYQNIDHLCEIGVIGEITQIIKLPNGAIKTIISCLQRCKIEALAEENNVLFGHYTIRNTFCRRKKIDKIIKDAISLFEKYNFITKRISDEMLTKITNISNPCTLADTIITHLSEIDLAKKQNLLLTFDFGDRLIKVINILSELIINAEPEISKEKKRTLSFQDQFKISPQDLLQDKDGGSDDLKILEEKIAKANMSQDAYDRARSELQKLKNMHIMSAESAIIRNYLEILLLLPWGKFIQPEYDIKTAIEFLDKKCFGLKELKQRVIEYLATYKRVGNKQDVVLCLVGPPGVGKTACAQLIAQVMGRKFVSIALGGIHDVAEIKGHRRTYVGAVPGAIIQAICKTQTNNAVILLDEIDKISTGYHNTCATLLEILDPNQNKAFRDYYLDIPYDISNNIFIATANNLEIMLALKDRLEIIKISSYTEAEKFIIAEKYLIPKQCDLHNVNSKEIRISESALKLIIQEYTKESGVRDLERNIAKILRQFLAQQYQNDKNIAVPLRITANNLKKYLGTSKYLQQSYDANNSIGVAIGLAWTEYGGEILQIETVLISGLGTIKTTGTLGPIMLESISIVVSYIKSRADIYQIDAALFEKHDIHVHLPDGATPKDGPSAGIAIFCSILSVLTKTVVKNKIAMTGEITLTGRVLRIGGLKEKILAAHRNNIREIIIPTDNAQDLEDIPKNILNKMVIRPISHVDSVVDIVFETSHHNINSTETYMIQ